MMRPHRQSTDSTVGPYAGQRAVLATMHAKEIVVAPAFRERLALTVDAAPGIDTDLLGTFTGEIPRSGTISEVAITKAHLGMALTGHAIGIASEGSYGPHPSIPFMPGGIEVMVLVDRRRNIIVSEYLVDDAPVYDHIVAQDIGSILTFLDRIRFAQHALIVRANEPDTDNAPIHKGLRTIASLSAAIAQCAAHSRDGSALIQTDMRAYMNETRMALLGRLAVLLCDRLATPCPNCRSPGFGQISVETGLPCAWCGASSIAVRHRVFGCVACDYREIRPSSDGRTQAEPGECPECNP